MACFLLSQALIGYITKIDFKEISKITLKRDQNAQRMKKEIRDALLA